MLDENNDRVSLLAFEAVLLLKEPYYLSFGIVDRLETTYVGLLGRGRFGFGEITPLPGYGHETADSIRRELSRLAATPRDMNSMLEELSVLAIRAPFLASGVMTAFELWREGHQVYLHGFSGGIDVASICNAPDIEGLQCRARALAGSGVKVLKMKVGGRHWTEDVERVKAVSAAVDRPISIRIDANKGLDLTSAVRLCRSLEGLQVELLEQPFGEEDFRSHARLARETSLPIMLDESIYTVEDVERAKDSGARLVKLKLCKHPGLQATGKMIEKARQMDLEVVLGNGVQSAIGNHFELILHMRHGLAAASEANGFAKVRNSLFEHDLEIRGGRITDGGLSSVLESFKRFYKEAPPGQRLEMELLA